MQLPAVYPICGSDGTKKRFRSGQNRCVFLLAVYARLLFGSGGTVKEASEEAKISIGKEAPSAIAVCILNALHGKLLSADLQDTLPPLWKTVKIIPENLFERHKCYSPGFSSCGGACSARICVFGFSSL